MKSWLCLVMALPTANATARMRAWRSLKSAGAAVLRDGAYLLPAIPDCASLMATVKQDILTNDGTAYLLPVQDDQGERFIPLFDRSGDYLNLRNETEALRIKLNADNAMEVAKQVRKLRRSLAQLSHIDFFPTDFGRETDHQLHELEKDLSRAISSDEPYSFERPIVRLNPADYQGRVWATRKRPWVDRLASAWLIRRLIDPHATFVWLQTPADCPPDALGFDFDGAAFSHVGKRVTFETLLASFSLETRALERMAALVHYLDTGGTQPEEAAGVERILAGMRATISDDDQLLTSCAAIFDGLLSAFEGENASE